MPGTARHGHEGVAESVLAADVHPARGYGQMLLGGQKGTEG
jgi:hypothetical protein